MGLADVVAILRAETGDFTAKLGAASASPTIRCVGMVHAPTARLKNKGQPADYLYTRTGSREHSV